MSQNDSLTRKISLSWHICHWSSDFVWQAHWQRIQKESLEFAGR